MQDKKPAQKTKKELLVENEKLRRINEELYGPVMYMAMQVKEIDLALNVLANSSNSDETDLNKIKMRKALGNLGMDRLAIYIEGLQDVIYLKSNPQEIN